jgi:hypothetical protein
VTVSEEGDVHPGSGRWTLRRPCFPEKASDTVMDYRESHGSEYKCGWKSGEQFTYPSQMAECPSETPPGLREDRVSRIQFADRSQSARSISLTEDPMGIGLHQPVVTIECTASLRRRNDPSL